MALEERTRPYETMIRHNRDGSIGSQHRKMYELLRDGVVIQEMEMPPEQLDGAGLDAVLGQAFVQATAQITAQAAQIASLQGQVSTITMQRDEALAQRNNLQADVENRVAVIAERDATIADLHEYIAILLGQIEQLTPRSDVSAEAPLPELDLAEEAPPSEPAA